MSNHSTFYILNLVTFLLFLLTANFSSIKVTGCGFISNENDSEDDFKYFVLLQNVSETLQNDEEIISLNTINITTVNISQNDSPFLNYSFDEPTQVLTFNKNDKSFSDFLASSTTSVIEYEIEIFCWDGETKVYPLLLEIQDENNEEPHFEHSNYFYKISNYTSLKSDEMLNLTDEYGKIKIVDRDYLRSNAELTLKATCNDGNCSGIIENPKINNATDDEAELTPGHVYYVDLSLYSNLDISVINLKLFVSDGKHETTSDIIIKMSEETEPIIVNPQNNLFQFILIAIAGLVTIVAVSVFIYKKIMLRRKGEIFPDLDKEIHEFKNGFTSHLLPRGSIDVNGPILSKPYNSQREISRDCLKIDETTKLGSGAYGTVWKGYVINRCDNTHIPVAIKTVRRGGVILQFRSLLSELKIMAYIGEHPNIVNLIGACTQNINKCEIYVAVELCSNGDFRSYLRSMRNYFKNMVNISGNVELIRRSSQDARIENRNSYCSITTVDLIRWSYQISNGMEFISDKRIIHGDLAARNILLDEHLVCKIADFGLSRKLIDYNTQNYMKKSETPLPWKYMAIESLKDLQFSLKTDIWTYGVLLWEIFTLGQKPYCIYPTFNKEFLARLEKGERLEMPKFAPREIRYIMAHAWEYNPDHRPNFTNIKLKLEEILQNLGGYTLMERNVSFNSGNFSNLRVKHKSLSFNKMSRKFPPIPERPTNKYEHQGMHLKRRPSV